MAKEFLLLMTFARVCKRLFSAVLESVNLIVSLVLYYV